MELWKPFKNIFLDLWNSWSRSLLEALETSAYLSGPSWEPLTDMQYILQEEKKVFLCVDQNRLRFTHGAAEGAVTVT